MKKTKIVCTIGPTSENRDTLKNMMLAGMNAARINFSHGTYEEHKIKMDLVKELRDELNLPIAIILDTKGPEIRTGTFENGSVELVAGQKFTLTTRDIIGNSDICSITYKGLGSDINIGDTILIDDGLIELTVNEIKGSDFICIVENGGEVKDYKGINVPGVAVKLPAITDRDKADIEFGISEDIDFIAASFVRRAADIKEMKWLLKDRGAAHIRVIAKIENKEGIDNIDEIIKAADGIMVARGDLGVEVPPEQVPIIQKSIIKKCNEAGKPVITATQMLDSMIRNPRPTRAEVADVANAIFDGTDAIMLSGETAIGKYPVESIKTMVNIAVATEDNFNYDEMLIGRAPHKNKSITNAIGYATCTSAYGLKAKAILTPTSSGYTAMVVSKFRPRTPILAFTRTKRIARRLALVWGAYPFVIPTSETAVEVFKGAVDKALIEGFIVNGDIVIITAGIPVKLEENTNVMRIHEVGKEL
ncbi:pyruvate kinase [Anaerovorax odorimutans]|uniref:pyruvate kinase n=1 Tax=Anaerovorax odorimutans TaxID=109327 RepID=UPI000427FEBC|nr:pyruvate kinase [Anaerovorax odorimutans]